jgi:Co/Zn/Cd efflux system component
MEDDPLIDHSKCHSFIDTVLHLDEDDGHSHDHHHHEHSHSPSNLSLKLIIIIVLTAIFFLAELVTGFITKSLSLQSDSFHMLSDLASLIIGLIAHNLAKKNRQMRKHLDGHVQKFLVALSILYFSWQYV